MIIDSSRYDVGIASCDQIAFMTPESKFAAIKASGLIRPRAIAPTSAYAALLAGKLVACHSEGIRTGVSVLSSTVTTEPCLRFERAGQSSGWDLVDPFLLPNTIASVAATHCSIRWGLKGPALTYTSLRSGLIVAVVHALELLSRNSLDSMLVIASEHASAEHQQVHTDLPCDGAAGLLLVRGGALRIALLGFAAPEEVPNEWLRCPEIMVPNTPFGSLVALRKLADLFERVPRVLIRTSLSSRTWGLIGLVARV